MRRPSILFINRVYPPVRGATGRILRDMARSFAREGWQVTVITTGPKAMKERDGAVRIIRVKGAEKPKGVFGYGWTWIKMLVMALSLPATNIVVSMTDPPFLAVGGAIIKRVKKNKHIHWCQDVYPDLFPSLGIYFPRILRRWMRKRVRNAMLDADKVIVIGRCMARYLSDSGLPPKRMSVVPNWPEKELGIPAGRSGFNGASHEGGVPEDIERFETGNRDTQVYREHREQVKTGPKFRVLYAGNIGQAHPLETILEAAEMLQQSNPEIEFLFVGDGPRYDEIAQVRSAKHLDNIRLLPYQPVSRLRELMESGDVHLISMKEEAAGQLVPSKLYAALAVNRPCVMVGPVHSEVGKVIADFKAGEIIPQGHAEELAACIRRFREDGAYWFAAQEGAIEAGKVFVPKAAIAAWMERAKAVLESI